MKITKKTRYAEIEDRVKYFDDESIKYLKSAAEAEYVRMYDLTFAQFLMACEGYTADIIGDATDKTVLQAFWLMRFEDFKKEFEKTLKNTNVPPKKEEELAAKDLPPQTFAESILIFTRHYFGLHSFREAEQITIGEIIIARKDAYNTAMYNRRLQAIQMNNLKQGKR